jgi:trans-2,3-dihydro-3-hydroxyanthranilate isomerase
MLDRSLSAAQDDHRRTVLVSPASTNVRSAEVNRSVAVDLFSVFADGPGGGNPCPVVGSADDLTTADMLGIARRHGHESVFLLTPGSPEAQVRMRYFVPKHEMEMCVHATVAGLTLLHERHVLTAGAVRVQTPLGLLHADIATDGTVTVDQFPPTIADAVPAVVDELAQVLGCPSEKIMTLDTPRAVSVSRSKLLVEVDGVATLHDLHPDTEAVRRVCEALDVTGLYPFALAPHPEPHVWARQFPRDSGYPEDAATGLAAAALAALLALRETEDGSYSYDIRQGQAMGRPSRITAHATRDNGQITRVAVSGRAHRVHGTDHDVRPE